MSPLRSPRRRHEDQVLREIVCRGVKVAADPVIAKHLNRNYLQTRGWESMKAEYGLRIVGYSGVAPVSESGVK
ncbi:hypothetical protein D7B24_008131 [Verticillium nonalfalfae]|uniref:Uncharacterized protein n=1 Tax=Verticillium nonalfalfae TaxID=1051616 RepID=A0A3M9YJ46_9PEZI|nr:uncharacterized protein D7B24_008131 [Verticillium nonalfalfae]RNJ60439.1 hypothetical protein D7B24_008131 [Verticillium nonalfalfae]